MTLSLSLFNIKEQLLTFEIYYIIFYIIIIEERKLYFFIIEKKWRVVKFDEKKI